MVHVGLDARPSIRATRTEQLNMDASQLFSASTLLCFALSAGCAEGNYMQTKCITTDDYLTVWFTADGRKDEDAPYQSVQFSQQGVLIRIKPLYYGPDWQHIGKIRYVPGAEKDQGVLTIEVLRDDGTSYLETAGVITKTCWTAIGRFLREKEIDAALVQ